VFNGEIYNFRELAAELGLALRSTSDTEVLLGAYARWGDACLERFIGMFAFAIYDTHAKRLFCARDRFGVKPFHYAEADDGAFLFASSVRALHAAGVPAAHDEATWARYLASGVYDDTTQTFWRGVHRLAPGHALSVEEGEIRTWQWYSAAGRCGEEDIREDAEAVTELTALLDSAIRLRLIADVPVGVCLSGGLDSSLLIALLSRCGDSADSLHAFTFVTDDERYDELAWVQEALRGTRHPHHVIKLAPAEVPALASELMAFEDEPFGGLPSLAMSKVFASAGAAGCKVLLDGQGVDESFAGYDSYVRIARGERVVAGHLHGTSGALDGVTCLTAELRELVTPDESGRPSLQQETIRAAQLRDLERTKLPRALRFNDRASMMSSIELREPFLDHRLVEFGIRQPASRKVRAGTGKWIVREVAHHLLPRGVVIAPKRPVQTPQREWLRGALAGWVEDSLTLLETSSVSGWLDWPSVRAAWKGFRDGRGENSFFVWQWLSLALAESLRRERNEGRLGG
jgi:asparagine synthase (glutamine-hydrolysing)